MKLPVDHAPVEAAHHGAHVPGAVRSPRLVDAGVKHRDNPLCPGHLPVGMGVVPHVGQRRIRREAPLPALVEAALPFGDALLPGHQAAGKWAKARLLHQLLDKRPRQVHIRKQPQGLAQLPQGLHHRQKIGVAPAEGPLHCQLGGHALPGGDGGGGFQLLPYLREGHFPAAGAAALLVPGAAFRLHPQPLEIGIAQLGPHQGEGLLGPLHLAQQQGVEHVEGNGLEPGQPLDQSGGGLPQALGGFAGPHGQGPGAPSPGSSKAGTAFHRGAPAWRSASYRALARGLRSPKKR